MLLGEYTEKQCKTSSCPNSRGGMHFGAAVQAYSRRAELPPTTSPIPLCSCFSLSYVHAITFTRNTLPCISFLPFCSSLPSLPSLSNSLQYKWSSSDCTDPCFHHCEWPAHCIITAFLHISHMIMKLWKNFNPKWNQMIWNGESHTSTLRRMELKNWDWFLYMSDLLKTKTSPDQGSFAKNLSHPQASERTAWTLAGLLPLHTVAHKCSLPQILMDSPVSCCSACFLNCSSSAIFK